MIQRMIKRRQNLEPIAFPKITRGSEGTIKEQLDAENESESSDAENQSESSDEESQSKSPAFNPTSAATILTVESYATSQPSTVKSTESSSARTQGPRTILERTGSRTGTRCGTRAHGKIRHVHVHGTDNHEQCASSIVQIQ